MQSSLRPWVFELSESNLLQLLTMENKNLTNDEYYSGRSYSTTSNSNKHNNTALGKCSEI